MRIVRVLAAALLLGSSASHAFDDNDTLWQVNCPYFFTAAHYMRSERTGGPYSDQLAIVERLSSLLQKTFPQYAPFALASIVAGGSGGTDTIYFRLGQTGEGSTSCDVVKWSEPTYADTVVGQLKEVRAAVVANAGTVAAVNQLRTEVMPQLTAMNGGAEPVSVNWAMVGQYWLVSLATVMGLWFTAMVCGEVIRMLKRAR